MSRDWRGLPLHVTWLRDHELALLDFGREVVRPDGLAAWLDDSGQPDPSHAAETWITARMAHVYYLGSLRGVPGCLPLAVRLMQGIDETARDSENGGWNAETPAVADGEKSAYAHAFVVLAAATGTMTGDERARRVLDDALAIVDQKFWEPEFGLVADTWSHDWSVLDSYRGINANMHMVEALLAASDATGDEEWSRRAIRICEFVVERAGANGWRIPEHFDPSWSADLEFNRDHQADKFKPYGATVGHALEWSRLLAQAAPHSSNPRGFITAARELYAGAVRDGWAPDGNPGFVYTTDWAGAPIVADRLHWVAAEAIGAAAVLSEVTGDATYDDDYARWWDYSRQYFIDGAAGSWHHQLDAQNQVSSTVWDGKPDLYHAYQAVVISQVPSSTSMARAVSPSPSGGMRSAGFSL